MEIHDLKDKIDVKENYRIFYVIETDNSILPKKIAVKHIYAEDNADACRQLEDYKKTAKDDHTYFVEEWSPAVVIRDGKKYVYEDVMESFIDRTSKNFFVRAYDAISLWLWRYFIDKPSDFFRSIKRIRYLLKYNQKYEWYWNIDDALLDVIAHNLPILKKHKHTLSWEMLNKAVLEKKSGEKDFNLDEYLKSVNYSYPEDVEKRSVELEHQMFDQLLDDIRAYRYYSGQYEYIDKKDRESVETDRKLRGTLPLMPGSYDSYEYEKINKMADERWNRIWDTVKAYGREFND